MSSELKATGGRSVKAQHPLTDVQIMDIELSKTCPFADWMQACGLPTINAAANCLGVHRHTAEAMRTRELTKIERLAMAAVYHRIKPFERS